MIGRLRGVLVSKQPPELLIDVGGVGYEVEAPMSSFYTLPAVGEQVLLHTHLIVREDAQLLYGFATEPERRLFRQLIRISGVGAKMALAILSGMSADAFVTCLEQGDVTSLTRLPGIGRKTAERLVVELRGRLTPETVGGLPGAVAGAPGEPGDAAGEAQAALVALGYKPTEAARMVKRVAGEGLAAEELIRRALQTQVRT